MCSKAYAHSNRQQALARLVAQILKKDGESTDRSELEAILKEASRALANPATSGVAKVLQQNLLEAILCMYFYALKMSS